MSSETMTSKNPFGPMGPKTRAKKGGKKEVDEEISFANITKAPTTEESLITVALPPKENEIKQKEVDVQRTMVKEMVKEAAKHKMEDVKKIPMTQQREAEKLIRKTLEPPKKDVDIEREVILRKIFDYAEKFAEVWQREGKFRFATADAYKRSTLENLKAELHQIQICANSTGVEPLIKQVCVQVCGLIETVAQISGADKYKYMEGYASIIKVQMDSGHYDEEIALIKIEYAEFFQMSPLQRLFAKMAQTGAIHVLAKKNAEMINKTGGFPASRPTNNNTTTPVVSQEKINQFFNN